MAKIAANATRLRDKLWVWFAHPAWRPQAPSDQPKQVFRHNFQKYLPQPNPKLKRYILAHFALLTLASGGFMAMAETATMLSLLFPSLLFVISLIALTGMIESKRWAFWVDLARQPFILLALAVYLPGEWSIWLTTVITLGVAWCFWRMLRWIYH